MKSKILKTVSVILCLLFVSLSLSAVTFMAETLAVTFLLTPTVYSSQRDTYIEQDTFKSGDIFYLKLSATKIANMGGFAFNVEFDTNKFSFLEAKTVSNIEDSQGDTSYRLDEANKRLQVVYTNGKYNDENNIVGAIYYLAFSVNSITENENSPFKITINELYDNTFAQKDISCNNTLSVLVNLVTETVSDEIIDLFKKLETIKYPDSKKDIDDALEAYNSLSAAQKNMLKQKYSKEFEWLNTANTRYNALAENATKEQILSEVNSFKKNYADVLKLSVDKVVLTNETRINAASNSLKGLSNSAKQRLSKEEKLIKSLLERIEEIKEVQSEIDEFLNNEVFADIFNPNILDYGFDGIYDEHLPAIELALLSYELLSDEAKAVLKSEYEWFKKLKAEADKYLELDKKSAELAEKSAQFQKQYLYVFTLNQNSVKVTDKSAIQMVIDAYKTLEDKDLKEVLKARIENLEKLLTVIEELEKNTSANNGETIVETVEVPGDTVTITETVEIPGGTVQLPSEKEYITNTNSLIKKITQKASLSNFILILFILLAISSTVLGSTYFICDKYKRKVAILNEEEAEL